VGEVAHWKAAAFHDHATAEARRDVDGCVRTRWGRQMKEVEAFMAEFKDKIVKEEPDAR
jgi:hypothetical protein